ncbi:MAG: hypothetical protein HETSPECPRED_002836 [Heterodermia speciosa]|uniref:BHLH domain-containing protein n=1 Tax=Heterodermia speciosa TaxID=116794 RepID=A0A8H3J5L4_9LECA|nr:MAG: hypothetical protein HETSPECPRED_002836 [Heterodermia speciosa]
MPTTGDAFWAPLEATTAPFSPFDASITPSGIAGPQIGRSTHSNTNPWDSSPNAFNQERALMNEQSMYRPAHSEPPGTAGSSYRTRPTAFAHGMEVEASYLGASVTSPMSLDPFTSASAALDFRAALQSGGPVSPRGPATDFLGPQTGHSMHTDPGFAWTSEENPSVRDASLQSCSAQSLSPALSNDQNPLHSPKLEQEDSDSSQKRSASTSRKKPRRHTHNAIEKRYRVKLNEKIAELRDSIPTLRQQAATTPGGSPLGDSSATDPVSGQKINKAAILERATEYVKHLESCNRRLQSELHRARAAAASQCQHPSHAPPQAAYASHGGSHDAAYSFDSRQTRQDPGDRYYSVEDLFSDDVRQL